MDNFLERVMNFHKSSSNNFFGSFDDFFTNSHEQFLKKISSHNSPFNYCGWTISIFEDGKPKRTVGAELRRNEKDSNNYDYRYCNIENEKVIENKEETVSIEKANEIKTGIGAELDNLFKKDETKKVEHSSSQQVKNENDELKSTSKQLTGATRETESFINKIVGFFKSFFSK